MTLEEFIQQYVENLTKAATTSTFDIDSAIQCCYCPFAEKCNKTSLYHTVYMAKFKRDIAEKQA